MKNKLKKHIKTNKILILLILICLICELFLIIYRLIIINKKPEYINSWYRIPSGLTSIVVYYDNLYVINNTNGEIYQYEKSTGKNLYLFKFPNGVWGIAQDSNSMIFVLHKDNSISKFSNFYKYEGRYDLNENNSSYTWIDIDSNDYIYLLDSKNYKILKFDNNMQKISEFHVKPKEKICSYCHVSKIIINSKDEIYYLQNITDRQAIISVFDLNGKLLKKIKINHPSKFSNLENIAISSEGNIYMNNFHEKQITVYDNSGKYKGSFYTDISKQILIKYPAGICGDKKDDLFYIVTDKILIFKYIKY